MRIVDLSHHYANDMPLYPGIPRPSFTDIARVEIDGYAMTDFGIHKVWLSAGRLILENLTNLDQLPERTLLVVAPMKVRGANGGPSRVFALIS